MVRGTLSVDNVLSVRAIDFAHDASPQSFMIEALGYGDTLGGLLEALSTRTYDPYEIATFAEAGAFHEEPYATALDLGYPELSDLLSKKPTLTVVDLYTALTYDAMAS